jgi:F-type H+-transporting ATPase subunit b
MESLITDFHVDVKLFIAQIVNFGIVFVVLYFFAFKPLIKNMSDRTDHIEKSLKDAEEINKKIIATDKEREQIISEAKKIANEIIDNANKLGEEKRLSLIVKAKEEIGQIIKDEKEKLLIEKEIIIKEAKKELVDIVILATKKVLVGQINEEKNKELIENLLR